MNFGYNRNRCTYRKLQTKINECAATLKSKITDTPKTAFVLGTGLGILFSDINQPETSKTLLKDRIFDCVIDFILYTSAQAQARIGIFCDKMKQFIFISTVVCLDHEHHLIINKEISRGHRFSLYVQNKAAAELIFLEAISTSLSQSPSYDLHKPTVDSEFLFQSKDKALG